MYMSRIHVPLTTFAINAGFTQALLQGNRYEDPPQSAATFKQLMQQRYGQQLPDFLETSWQDAAIQANRQFKFLLVYLHSPDHEVYACPTIVSGKSIGKTLAYKHMGISTALTCLQFKFLLQHAQASKWTSGVRSQCKYAYKQCTTDLYCMEQAL